MIQASVATQYIANGLNSLIQSNQLYGKLTKSKSSVSLYLNTKSPTTPPQKSVRASNHHPTLANMVKGKKKPWNTTNISVEFYEQRLDTNGSPIKNRTRTTVYQNAKGTIQPFSVTIYEYQASDIEQSDIALIYSAVLSFIKTGVYKDPLGETPKAAKVSTKTATIKNKRTPKTSATESIEKHTAILTESDLRMMVKECVKTIIYESYSKRRIGKYDVIEGDNQPHSIKGLEQYGKKLYDVRLYSEVNDKKKTFAVFSIGRNTSKYICCHLETDDEYGVWLGFTPLEKHDVPALIKQDLKENPTNR